ncbi:RNA12 protein-domain-containing protein [Lipomyces japonicus]|uniref:RNA12 protein-domain-containing protein n=1 Tax=Lipomyces japonicus TaxID=56871 RepID=UPI0034CDB9FE
MNRLLSHVYSARLPVLIGQSVRPLPACRSRILSARSASRSGYEEIAHSTGLIERKPGEGLVYFDNIYPVRYSIWDIRQLLVEYVLRRNEVDLVAYIKKHAFPKDLSVEIKQVIPRPKDGGLIVKFAWDVANHTEEELQQQIEDTVEINAPRAWFNPIQKLHSYKVKGIPWVEDLHRFPSSRLRVVFEGPDIEQEGLYFLFRRYGVIKDIIPLSPSSKEEPRYAHIQFDRIRSAASARNCLHGMTAPEGTKIHIYYEPTSQKHFLREWIFGHPRIVIPAIAALLAGLTVIIFDPIRTWFIKQKITKRFSLVDNKYVAYLRSLFNSTIDVLVNTGGLRRFGLYSNSQVNNLQTGFSDRRDIIEQLNILLKEQPETFIVIQGPKGSGKIELVQDYVIRDRPNTLTIDCQRLTEARNDAVFIKEISSQTGYFPVFPWMNNISQFMDLIVQGVIGQKAGFSESRDAQFKNILENTATALRQIAAEKELIDKRRQSLGQSLANDGCGESVPIATPVVVIENFLLRSDKHEDMYKYIAEWAAVLILSNAAQVIFITDDVAHNKILAESLPNQVLNTITVGDATPELARSFVLRQILAVTGEKEETVPAETLKTLDQALEPLGGRMSDLLTLVRRVTVGESNLHAVQDMIRQSAAEITKKFLKSSKTTVWTSEQAWILIKLLSEHEDIKYNELFLNPLFKGASEAIMALQHAELILVLEKDGRPYAIKAGRPIYQAAFKKLTTDKVLTATLEISTLTALSAVDSEAIVKYEDELFKLSSVAASISKSDVAERVKYLTDKIRTSQSRITEFEKNIVQHKRTIAKEY